MNLRKKITHGPLRGSRQFRVISVYMNHLQKDHIHLHICRMTLYTCVHTLCIKKKRLVERVAKKVSIQIITLLH